MLKAQNLLLLMTTDDAALVNAEAREYVQLRRVHELRKLKLRLAEEEEAERIREVERGRKRGSSSGSTLGGGRDSIVGGGRDSVVGGGDDSEVGRGDDSTRAGGGLNDRRGDGSLDTGAAGFAQAWHTGSQPGVRGRSPSDEDDDPDELIGGASWQSGGDEQDGHGDGH